MASEWKPFKDSRLAPTEWCLSFWGEDEEDWVTVGWYETAEEANHQLDLRIKHCNDSKWRIVRTDVMIQGRGTDGVYYGKGVECHGNSLDTKWHLQSWGEISFCRYWTTDYRYDKEDRVMEHFDRLMVERSPWLWRVVRVDVIVQT
ncbi:MAG: hypothetical protein ISN29_05260 [Gammaproteobacteria bacterium AqS3]|nr:hypothetical protein [Gammaproteobacteria bacterium AqS3]